MGRRDEKGRTGKTKEGGVKEVVGETVKKEMRGEGKGTRKKAEGEVWEDER